VDFGAATAGVTFNYDPVTQQFGALSQSGVNGVFRAAAATDIGSPGRITAAATPPRIQAVLAGDLLRIEFDAEAGRHYTLEVRSGESNDAWTLTGEMIYAQTSGRMFFERDVTKDAEFFRVRAE
jgi:hypothetical protein